MQQVDSYLSCLTGQFVLDTVALSADRLRVVADTGNSCLHHRSQVHATRLQLPFCWQ